MRKKKIIAMLLAGGQGTRLGLLTKDVAKPAVPFGGKYRIIDFPLSNCTNSGIDVVGVLTQFQPLELNSYIGSGQPWDLDLINGGAFVLPPYHTGKTGDWYKGTANAIYQNMSFIDDNNPQYIVILSGDHIYKMDYAAMLKAHIDKGADATIAVYEVPWEEAPRFGILNTKEDDVIERFPAMTSSSERDWLPICARVCSRREEESSSAARHVLQSLYDRTQAPADGAEACRRHDLTSKAGACVHWSAALAAERLC